MMQMRWLWGGILGLLVVALGIAGGVIWMRLPLGTDELQLTPTAVARTQSTIQLSPAEGYAGTRVEVVGAGWPPETMVIVALEDEEGRSGVLAASTTDATGALRTAFTYPLSERWLQSDTQTVVAYASNETVEVKTTFALVEPAGTATADPAASVTATVPSTVAAPTATPPATAPPPTPTDAPTPAPTLLVVQGWRGDYWSNPNFEGEPALIRDDPNLQFDWGLSSPAHAVQADNFSAQWTRTLEFVGGRYQFRLEVDDGARLYVDDQLILDAWQGGARRTVTAEQELTPGPHHLRVDYYEASGAAAISLDWAQIEPTTPTSAATLTATPTTTTQATQSSSTTIPASNTPISFSVRVRDGRDDAEEQTDGSVKHDSDELDLVEHEETDAPQIVGVRFQNVEIPQGAQITLAYIVFTAEENADRPTTLYLQGEAVGDSAQFSSEPHTIGARARTTSGVPWANIPPWMTPGETHITPNVAPVIQEIVDRTDWRAGNALTILITGSGQRLAEAYDEMPDAAPLLYVEYVE